MKNPYSFTNYEQIQKCNESTFALPIWEIKNLTYVDSPYATIDNLLFFFKKQKSNSSRSIEKVHVTWKKNCYLLCAFNCLYVCPS